MTDDERNELRRNIRVMTAHLRLQAEAIEARLARENAQRPARPLAKVLEFKPRSAGDVPA